MDFDIISVKTLDTTHLREIEEIQKEVNLDAIMLRINNHRIQSAAQTENGITEISKKRKSEIKEITEVKYREYVKRHGPDPG